MLRHTEPTAFTLAAGLRVGRLADSFRRHGRVRLSPFLADAEPLRRYLTARDDWRQVINSGDKLFELDRATRADMSAEKAAALDAAIFEGASDGFQYRFESIRVPDDEPARARASSPLGAFASWMSSGEPRDLLREICGTSAIDFADAQATLFSPGDFLTAHNDSIVGKKRHAAYVLGLTPGWRTEWGGLLLFHDAGGADVIGAVPAFNTIDLFTVPQVHSVSLVSPAAKIRRLSVTGWLRSGDE